MTWVSSMRAVSACVEQERDLGEVTRHPLEEQMGKWLGNPSVCGARHAARAQLHHEMLGVVVERRRQTVSLVKLEEFRGVVRGEGKYRENVERSLVQSGAHMTLLCERLRRFEETN